MTTKKNNLGSYLDDFFNVDEITIKIKKNVLPTERTKPSNNLLKKKQCLKPVCEIYSCFKKSAVYFF